MINNIAFDPNRIDDPLLQKKDHIENNTIQRIVSVAIPFLNLNPITAQGSSFCLGLFNSYHLILDLMQESNWRNWGVKGLILTLTITSTVFALLFPFGQFVISNSFGCLMNLYDLGSSLWNHEWKEAGSISLKLAMQGVYMSSIVVATSEWILSSILLQAISEGYRSFDEFSAGHIVEGVAHLALTGIRGYGALPHIQKVYRDHHGQILTQEKWEQLYAQMKDERDVEQLLIKHDISSYVKNINFSETAQLSDAIFRNLDFQNCDFSNVDFSKSHFSHVRANSSLFKNSTWINSVIQNSYFTNCDFSFSYLNSSYLGGVTFDRCHVLETSFLGAHVKESRIARSDLTDCMLANTKEEFKLEACTPNIFTKPVVGIVWNFHGQGTFAPLMDLAIRENGAIPLRFEVYPDDIDFSKLGLELESSLEMINKNPREGALSPASELIKGIKSGTEMAKVAEKAALYARHLDGILLTGGDDITPASYGAVKEPKTDTEFDLRRLAFEYAMIHEAHKRSIPTLGICRGSQLINVYFGGTLKQHVDGHFFKDHEMEFADSSRKEWAQEFFGKGFRGYSAHHQASDKIGKDLEVVLKVDDVPKLMMSKDGTFIASQIHPEIYIELKKAQYDLKKWLLVLDRMEIRYKSNPKALEEIHQMRAFIEGSDVMMEKNQNLYRYFIAKAADYGSQKSTASNLV